LYYFTITILYTVCFAGYTQGDKLMRQPSYVPDTDQLLKDFHGVGVGSELLDDVAPDAVSISVDEYLNPQDVRRSRPPDSHTDDSLFSSVSALYPIHTNVMTCWERADAHCKLLAVQNCQEIFYRSENFCPKMLNLGLRPLFQYFGKFRNKSAIFSTQNIRCRNSQVSVGILS